MSLFNENPAMVENIGKSESSDQQINPVFDVDAYETDININDIETNYSPISL